MKMPKTEYRNPMGGVNEARKSNVGIRKGRHECTRIGAILPQRHGGSGEAQGGEQAGRLFNLDGGKAGGGPGCCRYRLGRQWAVCRAAILATAVAVFETVL